MNEMIKTMFQNFSVDGESIPVKYMHYMGHGEPYIVYMRMDDDNSISGDDDLIGYVEYYDLDVYSKSNFTKIIESVKQLMRENGWVWQLSRSSQDMYEVDTGYYHRTLNFAYMREEKNDG